MARPEYSSNVLQLASDATYAAQGDAYDGTPTKTTPSALALVTQGARPSRQMSARLRNWFDSQIVGILTALIADTTALQAFVDPALNGLRLSVSSADSVPTADATAASTLYLQRHGSSSLALYDPTTSTILRCNGAGVSLALAGLTAGLNYDVFAYWTGTAVALELGAAWANDTTPPALTYFDGVPYKGPSGTPRSRRLVGSIRATGATTTEDSAAKRFVYNEYNQVRRHQLFVTATASWTYASGTVRQANAQTGAASYRYEFLTRRPVTLESRLAVTYQPSAANVSYFPSIGIDSTSAASSTIAYSTGPVAAYNTLATAEYAGVLPAGYHAAYWLESASGANVTVSGGLTGSSLRGAVHI